DLALVLSDAKADAARTLAVDQDQPHSRLVELLAEQSSSPRGLVAEHPLEVLAHDVDAQGQQGLEIGLAHRPEAPVAHRVPMASRCGPGTAPAEGPEASARRRTRRRPGRATAGRRRRAPRDSPPAPTRRPPRP